MAQGSGTQGSSGTRLDRQLLLWLCGVVLVMIAAVSIFAPMEANSDPRPSTYNTAPGGAKAAYLTLKRLGWSVEQWNHPLADLKQLHARQTTLVLAEPSYSALQRDQLSTEVKNFLERGGHVLATGQQGALLLPDGSTKPSRRFGSLCYTQPEGPGALAQAGHAEMADAVRWGDENAKSFTEQRCGQDAVVVRFPVGAGEAIWWSSATPLTNAELHNGADLHLLLASLGEGRRVLFDEALYGEEATPWSAARDLPLRWLAGQLALMFLLLVFSFSRRRGPLRLPVAVPRSSPVEFAINMGDLYEHAQATGAATEAARRHLLQTLERDAGLSQLVLRGGAQSIMEALTAKFGGGWAGLGAHLHEAEIAADLNPKAGSALRLVQALAADGQRVRGAASGAV